MIQYEQMPVSLQQNRPHASHGIFLCTFGNFYFPDPNRRRLHCIRFCFHIAYITPRSHAYHNIMVCRLISHIRQAEKENSGNNQRTQTDAKNTVLLEQRGEMLPNAPHPPLSVSQSVSQALTFTQVSLQGTGEAAAQKTAPPCWTAGLHYLIWPTVRVCIAQFIIQQKRNSPPQKVRFRGFYTY